MACISRHELIHRAQTPHIFWAYAQLTTYEVFGNGKRRLSKPPNS